MGRGALVQSKGGLLSYIGGGGGVGQGGLLPSPGRPGGLLPSPGRPGGPYVVHSVGIKLASQFLWTRKNAHVLK